MMDYSGNSVSGSFFSLGASLQKQELRASLQQHGNKGG
jgi:hypothetical protein